MWSFGSYGDYDDGRVDRDCWAQKSAAASRREEEAKKLLDTFIGKCAKLPQADFPKTDNNLIKANIHLTNPCWLSFRKYALSKGCQVKRREATVTERQDSKNKRKGKMYVISATLSVHPSRAVAAVEEKKQQSAVASAKRKEREKQKAEEKANEDTIKRQRIIDAYDQIAAGLPTPPAVGSSAAAVAPTAVQSSAVAPEETPQQASTTVASSVTSNVPPSSAMMDPQLILKHADEVYNERLKEIRISVYHEKRSMEKEIERKQDDLEKKALELCKQVKQSVLASMPSSKQCSSCKKSCKLLVAECLRDGCNNQICADCLENKVNDENRCYLCKESWLGKKPAITHDDSTIRHGNSKGLAKFDCTAHRYGSTGLDYVYCCERRVCDGHRLKHNCCVCSGGRALCTSCGINRCSRCGKELCSTCSYKEGCMCAGKSERQIFMEEFGGCF